jgi:ABC-type nitrate/sulfonate/bicarbonate transport system substrate-binding protein
MLGSPKSILISSVAAVIVMISGCGERKTNAPSGANAPTKLTLKLHWIPDTHQLGFWVALDKGLYREHGLDMTIFPGGMDANPLRDVINGSADLGQVGGIEQVVLAANEGLPMKAIAAIHRRSPHALISLKSRPIEKPSDFQGKTIAVAFGDTAEILLKAYMDKEGIPLDSVKLVPFRYDLTPLLLGEVDAVTGFSTGQPVTLKEKGKEPCVLSYDSAGVKSYGYTIVVSKKTMAEKGPALRTFLAASREGWQYAFAHPDESAALFKKRFGDAVEIERTKAELNLIRSLMLDDKGELAKWNIDDTVVQGVKDMLVKYSGVKKDLPTTVVFDNSYLDE